MPLRRISSAILRTAAAMAAFAAVPRAQAVTIDLSTITAAATPIFDYDAGGRLLVIGPGGGLAAGDYVVTGSLPAGALVDSIYINTETGADVNILWTAHIGTADKSRGALIATGGLGDGIFTFDGATITVGAGSAVNAAGAVAVINADLSGGTTAAPLVRSTGNVYIGNSTVSVTGGGAGGTAVSAADTVFITSGSISGRNTAVFAGKSVFIDDGATGSAPHVLGAAPKAAVTIEADSAAIRTAGNVLVDNSQTKIINRPTGVAPAIADRGAAIWAGSVEILDADSIAAMGIGTAIRLSGGADVSTISSGVIFSESGTAVRSDGASVVIDGNTAVVSNAAGAGTTIPDFGAIRVESAAASVTFDIRGGVTVSATGLNASAVHANKSGAGALTLTVGDAYYGDDPKISSVDGSAVSLKNGAALVMSSGELSNGSTNGLAVIAASGAVTAGTDVVTVNGGTIIARETSGRGAGIRVTGNGGVTVDGDVEITANGTNGRAIETEAGQATVAGAVKIFVDEGALSAGIETTTGNVTVRNAEIEVTNGIGVLTAGGAVTVNASPGMSAAVRATVGGTPIRAARPSASGRAGTVRIGGSAGDKSVVIRSVFGRAVYADDTVRVLDYANVSTQAGKAIVGNHVVIGTINNGAAPVISASGAANVDTAAAVTVPAVTGSAVSVTMNGGKITAGTPHPSREGEAEFTAAAITVVGTVTGVVRIGDGSIEAYGPTPAINSASPNVDVFIGSADGGAPLINTGDGGTAISAAGRIQMDGGDIRAGTGSKGISITGNKTLLITKGSVTVGDSGTAIVSAAAVTDSIVGSGTVTVLGKGTAISAQGRVILSDDATVAVDSGTAISANGEVTLAGGAAHSKDTCVSSPREVRIIGNNVRLSGVVDANASASGVIAVVSPGGTPAFGRTMIIPAGKAFNLSQRATLAAGQHDTIIIYGSVSTAAATAEATGYFENSGKVVVAGGGNVSFGAQTKATLENKNGLFVLSTGATFNSGVIDYFAWADTLSDFDLRGPGTVLIPPHFADSAATWGDTAAITAQVYTAADWQLALNEDFKNFMGDDISFFTAAGDFPKGVTVNGSTMAISPHGGIVGLLTAAGKYTFTARAENEAGFAEKDFTVTVTPLGIAPELGKHFAAIMSLGGDQKILSASTSEEELRYGGGQVTAEITGANISGYNTTYSGFGKATFLWREEDAPLSETAPRNIGTYAVFVSLAKGDNFEAAGEDEPIALGKLTVSKNTLAGILGETGAVVRTVELPAGHAIRDVSVPIPDVARYGAAYEQALSPVVPDFSTVDPGDLIANGNAWISAVGGSWVDGIWTTNAVLMFHTTDKSVPGDELTFKLTVVNSGAENLIEGTESDVFVTVYFKHEDDIVIKAAEYDRVIKDINDNAAALVVNPAKQVSTTFSAGPNPVTRSQTGKIVFFRQGVGIANGTVSIFDAAGNLVKRVDVKDISTATNNREIGHWDLTDAKNRPVPAGTYLIRGVLNTKDGKREKVSQAIGVR